MISNELKEKLVHEVQQKITHFNIPQQKAIIVNANIIVAIVGRAGGKTHGFISPTAIRNVKGMPRGGTGFVGPTYIKLENDLIPALTKALEKFGFYEGVDYWVGQSIPKSVKHEDPFECPRNPQYSIFWRNGHIFRIIGLDRKDSGNAQSNDFIINDEAKFTNRDAFNSRIVPTNRGNEDVFGHLHYHHGILFCSDMPTSPESQWLFEYEEKMDPEQIDLIVSYDHALREYIKQIVDELLAAEPGLSQQVKFNRELLLSEMRNLVAKGKLHEALEKRFRKELQRLDGILFELRREAVYFVEASTLDNIDVVTERYLRQMKQVLTPRQFNASILNIREVGAEDKFYANFDEVKHTYVSVNYEYTDNYRGKELPQPWRKDKDVDITRGLDISCDWGGKINCAAIGQEFPKEFRVLNGIFVKKPKRIIHLAKAINAYYIGYPVKKIRFYYDHTATKDDASNEDPYWKDFENAMVDLGWRVESIYIGGTASQDSRYKLFGRVYAEDDPDTKPMRINRNNCGDMITAINSAGSYEEKEKIKKDKKPERSKLVPPEHATHQTDALDNLYIGVFQNRLGSNDYEPDYTM
ncbi:hypothetical protein EOD41_10775 [Mucilaginibacter limnophilus]|uniref:Uncharacterized protein n=1 Tax=Mucilaginibacter limnophilus TaxID=1932778 RepID=A0A437MTW5_9SPHI|nr:hypothetical protein [Mucilaginibacter limnophilus]RVU01089.1 hypothetical protein EOD41_10775 [Mucilaginibacter limnophilus]